VQDGRELWRADGAGTPPSSPVVNGETVYSLGVADNGYQIGAYRTSDGQAIWQTDVGPYAWCCTSNGVALAGGLLAIGDGHSIGVYDAKTGDRLWSHAPEGGAYVGYPMIAGDQVMVSAADQPGGDSFPAPRTGSITAYDLRSGDIRWRNTAIRTFWTPLASTATGVLYAGSWQDAESGQLAFISTESGETIWTAPLPRVEEGVQTYIEPGTVFTPMIVGDTAYVTVSTVAYGGTSIQNSLLAAIDLADGSTRWLAQLDGTIVSTPIVSGGRIFLLTQDAGMTVLEASGQAAQAAGTTVDLRTPVLCNALPSESPLLGELPASPSIPGVAAWKQPFSASQVPTGIPSNVDQATAAQLAARFKEYRSCSAIDPYNSVFGFFSTDFYVRLKPLGVGVYDSDEHPWAVWMSHMGEYLYLDPSSVRMLPDGRVGAVIKSPHTDFYTWWVQEEGVWKIDEYHRIQADSIDPNAPTPPPSVNAEGMPFG
jgi:hypothetical protein